MTRSGSHSRASRRASSPSRGDDVVARLRQKVQEVEPKVLAVVHDEDPAMQGGGRDGNAGRARRRLVSPPRRADAVAVRTTDAQRFLAVVPDPPFGATFRALETPEGGEYRRGAGHRLLDRAEEGLDLEGLPEKTGRAHGVGHARIGVTGVSAGHQDDGDLGAKALEGLAGRIAGKPPGQVHVQQDQIDRVGAQEFEALLSSRGDETLALLRGQEPAEDLGHGGVVFDDQKTHSHSFVSEGTPDNRVSARRQAFLASGRLHQCTGGLGCLDASGVPPVPSQPTGSSRLVG